MTKGDDGSGGFGPDGSHPGETDGELGRSADGTLLSIENVARMFRVSQVALRYYEARGLVKRRHRVGRVRVFSWADCDRIVFIIKCRRAGLTLHDIMPVIAATDDVATPEDLSAGQDSATALIHLLERRRRTLDDALAELQHLHRLLVVKSADPGAVDKG